MVMTNIIQLYYYMILTISNDEQIRLNWCMCMQDDHNVVQFYLVTRSMKIDFDDMSVIKMRIDVLSHDEEITC